MSIAPRAPNTPNLPQNHLLAVLPKSESERLFPLLELIPLPLGEALYESGNRLNHVYFHTTAIVSLLYVMENGASAEIAVVGNDGIVGKVFIILTILGPFLIAGVTILPSLLSTSRGAMGSPPTKIALRGADPRFVQEISPAFQQSKIEVRAVQGSTESLDSQVQAGAYDEYLVVPADLSEAMRLGYVSKNAADSRVLGVLQA